MKNIFKNIKIVHLVLFGSAVTSQQIPDEAENEFGTIPGLESDSIDFSSESSSLSNFSDFSDFSNFSEIENSGNSETAMLPFDMEEDESQITTTLTTLTMDTTTTRTTSTVSTTTTGLLTTRTDFRRESPIDQGGTVSLNS